LRVIAPSIDPFSLKNADLPIADAQAILLRAGLLAGPDPGHLPGVRRADGTPLTVRRHPSVLMGGAAPRPTDRLIVQVSRWDRLKDMTGVLRSFVDHLTDLPPDAHLMLTGPDVSGVTDDPEGAAVLADCVALWRSCPEQVRARVHLATLPMDDPEENALLVNALQRHAAVVVQKSLVEGFGLTVTEPMWKARPVVASAVGGIQDQVVDGECGLLLPDPADLDGFAERVLQLVGDPERAERLGASAKERVRDLYLVDRHLNQYVDVFTAVLSGGAG